MKVSLLFPLLKGMQGAEFLEQAKLPVGERALEFEKDRDEREPGEGRATKVGCSGCGCSDLTLMKGDDGSRVSSKLIPPLPPPGGKQRDSKPKTASGKQMRLPLVTVIPRHLWEAVDNWTSTRPGK